MEKLGDTFAVCEGPAGGGGKRGLGTGASDQKLPVLLGALRSH